MGSPCRKDKSGVRDEAVVGTMCRQDCTGREENETLRLDQIMGVAEYPVGQGCQTHFHRGPCQPRGCLQRAECNFRTV